MSHQWDAKLNVGKPRYKQLADKKKLLVTTFAADREEAIADVLKYAKSYGYDEATVDHIARFG